ncbi:MAG: MBL fold metallo-hydrolase [Dermatophilaceae bacterium]
MLNNVQHTSDATDDEYAQARLTISGEPVTVHAIRCGIVTIKQAHACGLLPERTPFVLRFLAILADPRFVAPMPVWTYVIERAGALTVVDTGVDPGYNDPSTWGERQRARRLVQSFLRLELGRGGSLSERMTSLGLAPTAVTGVVLTHQHIDHTGGVPAFEGSDVWTTDAEDRAAATVGAEHWRWRTAATRIRYIDIEGEPLVLDGEHDPRPAVDLLGDGSLVAVHTPGHTPGSVTVRLTTDQADLWFTGDTCFTAAGMDASAPTAGIHTDLRAVRRLQGILQDRGVIFPSHDPLVPRRLSAVGKDAA